MLCVSTTQGVYIVDGQGASRCLGLEKMIVSQIAVQGTSVLAAVPEVAEVCLLLRCMADIASCGIDSKVQGISFLLSLGHRRQT